MLDIETALKEHCADQPQFSTLLAQWTFDKQLVGRALGAVSHAFPNYSLHDASHCETILRQIARLLGAARVRRLSPTDLWLLLESAYHHDLGMVVPDEQMRTWWQSKEFAVFLTSLAQHSDPELRRAATILEKRPSELGATKTWPFDVRRALALAMAEYARPEHPGRSRSYIGAPEGIGLTSPRTPLVPRRFWRLLGRICESHGQDLADVLRLPARESGFGLDDAHPRFIACMLRLGDLLDLDDGRFCATLARSFGGLPASSKSHEAKHQAIHEFFVDPAEIRVVAECNDPESFDATEQWLAWLRKELRDQSEHWNRIRPELDFGALPSPGRIEVTTRGFNVSPTGQRPRFEVDRDAMLDFVKGAGMYADESACISELLQNAVDATILRVWQQNKKKWLRLSEDGPDSAMAALRKSLSRYPIHVRVKRKQRQERLERLERSATPEHNHWTVTIRDRGIGITGSEIRYLQSVGSSRKNPNKLQLTSNMPEWMRPSGYFGIGLQSVFLFTDKVTIRSRATVANETLEIELREQQGTKTPQIMVRTVSGKNALKFPGTQVSFTIQEHRIPTRYSISVGRDTETERVVRDYDGLVDADMPLVPSRIRDMVRMFAEDTLATVLLDGQATDVDVASAVPAPFFDPSERIEVALTAGTDGRFSVLYRGRSTSEVLSLPFFSGTVNLHRGTAAEILMLNRENFRAGADENVSDWAWRAILKAAPIVHQQLLDSPDGGVLRQHLALGARLLDDLKEASAMRADDSWGALPFRNSEVTLKDLDGADEIRFVVDPSLSDPDSPRTTMQELNNRWVVTTVARSIYGWIWRFRPKGHWRLESVESIEGRKRPTRRYTWCAQKAPVENPLGDESALRDAIRAAAGKHRRSARRTLPCPMDRFPAIALKVDSEQTIPYVARTHGMLFPQCFFPFRVMSDGTLTLDGIPELISFTFKNRFQAHTSELDIAATLLEFAQYVNDALAEDIAARSSFDLGQLRYSLGRKYGREHFAAK